jgi:mycofactocin biosynthesis protein MftB
VSTEALAATAAGFDLDRAWQLHPQVSVRPERFGALLYHFGTRRLSFLKSPALLTVVSSLGDAPSARAACAQAGVRPAELPAYATALATLASSQMIRAREGATS